MNQAAEQSGLFGGGSLGTVLLIVGMVLSVAIVSGLGFIARMNDRSAERKAARRADPEQRESNSGAGSDAPRQPRDGSPGGP